MMEIWRCASVEGCQRQERIGYAKLFAAGAPKDPCTGGGGRNRTEKRATRAALWQWQLP